MSKQGYEPAPTAPLPSAPPPPYDNSFTQPPYNPNVQTSMPPYQYQPAPHVHEAPLQSAQALYPQHQRYPPQPKQVTLSVPAENRVVVGVPLLVGPQSLRTTCPNCRASIQTRTTTQSKGITHLICLGLCLIGCCLCSCIPYCVDSLKEVRHTCPKCKAHLGTYRS